MSWSLDIASGLAYIHTCVGRVWRVKYGGGCMDSFGSCFTRASLCLLAPLPYIQYPLNAFLILLSSQPHPPPDPSRCQARERAARG